MLRLYDDGEEETETYSLVIDDKQDAPIRIKAKMNGSDTSMSLTGETLQVFAPEESPIKMTFFLDRIDEEEAKRRLALAAKRITGERKAGDGVLPEDLSEIYDVPEVDRTTEPVVPPDDSPPGGDE